MKKFFICMGVKNRTQKDIDKDYELAMQKGLEKAKDLGFWDGSETLMKLNFLFKELPKTDKDLAKSFVDSLHCMIEADFVILIQQQVENFAGVELQKRFCEAFGLKIVFV